jgi:hypothetical protein
VAYIYVIPIVAIVMGLSVAILAVWTEHKKDMALIEKGLYQPSKPGPRGQGTLLWGLLLTFAGMAFVIASARLSDGDLLLPGLWAMGVGLALLIYSLIVKRQKPPEE